MSNTRCILGTYSNILANESRAPDESFYERHSTRKLKPKSGEMCRIDFTVGDGFQVGTDARPFERQSLKSNQYLISARSDLWKRERDRCLQNPDKGKLAWSFPYR